MRTLSILTIVCIPIALFAQGSSTGVSQLKLPFTARNASMGEALVAEPGQVGSATVNPANLLGTKHVEILLSHTEWIQDLQSEYFAVGIPSEYGTVSISISSTNNSGIEVRDKPGPTVATFTARSASLQASYATTISPAIGIGVSGKFLYDKLYIEEATGFAFDVGLLYYSPAEGFVLGASVANIGEMSAFVKEQTDLPLTARVGGSYKTDYEDFAFTFASQFVSERQSLEDIIQFGVEVGYKQTVALRLGYQTGFESRSLSGGFGANYEWLQFDYAYVPFSLGLGNAHLFTVRFTL